MPASRLSRHALRLFGFSAAVAVLASLGCVDHNAGGKRLFVYDSTSSSVLVWDDVNALYSLTAGATPPAPDRTITSSYFTSMATPLAWGGLTVDSTANMLYLVTEGGVAYAVFNASSQTGDLESSSDITSFNLGNSSDHYSDSFFGQTAVDPSVNTLYALETTTNGTSTRIWYVSTVSEEAAAAATPTLVIPVGQTFTGPGDTWGIGLAAGQNAIFAAFSGGNSYAYNSTTYSGPRVRIGAPYAFSSVTTPPMLIGASTLLPAAPASGSVIQYGTLAYDPLNSLLFVNANASQILVFNQGDFNNSYGQAPDRILTNPSSALRILSHPADSDWLLGADFTAPSGTTSSGTGTPTLYIWNTPSSSTSTAVSVPLPATSSGAVAIRGMTIAGGD